MTGTKTQKLFASILVAICYFMFAAPASAQLNNPVDCPAFNRNWQCTSIGLNPAAFTTCVETVRGGVVVDRRTRTFNGEAAFNQFLNMAPAGTVYRQCGAVPSCTPTTETRTDGQQCPAGQTGVITETRTINVGGVCNSNSAWTVTSNTCAPCQQQTETRTKACPSGQIGEIIETRTLNTGGYCGRTSEWTETTNTCRVPPATVCPLPWGGSIPVGQSVTAYKTQNGIVCEAQTRVCREDGTLSGSYMYQSCTVTCVQKTETRTDGQQCPAGQSGTITETRTVNVGGVCGSDSAWTVTSNTCKPITCALPWGGTINVGQSVTAYETSNGLICKAQTRTCLPNGTLSGSYMFQNCTVTCTQGSETRTNGQQCPAGQSGVITETRTTNTNGVCGAYGQWTVTTNTCKPNTCALPWGGTINVGESVTAYKKVTVTQANTTNTSATVIAGICAMAKTSNLTVMAGMCSDTPVNTQPTPNTYTSEICLSETRTCLPNGTLTGSYTQRDCTATPSCTQTTETRTLTCPSGQSGIITETRTVNTNGVCNAISAWTVTSNTCQPIPPQTCTFNGQVLQNGQSVTAYQTQNGVVCQSETRTCTNGQLSGSYMYASCTVTPPVTCVNPFGGTLNVGQSIVAYKDLTVPNGGTCYYETRVCQSNGQLSGSFTQQSCTIQQPQTCTTPWGTVLQHGQSVTAYQTQNGTVCNAETRVCNNGVLSGSYMYQSCTSTPQTCTFNGQVLQNGQSVTAYQTSTTPYGQVCQSETRTCSNGNLSGSYSYSNCTPGQPQSCNLPWGGTLAHGQSVTAYQTQNGTVCQSQTRTCNNGQLSGSYTYQSCTVTPVTCANPFGGTLNVGQSIVAYRDNSVPNGGTCHYETRVCQANGQLSGSFTQQSCTIQQPQTCTFNGQVLQHGQSVTAYQTSTTPYGQVCQSETRTCSNGNLSGSFTYGNCTPGQPQSCTLPNGGTIGHGQSVTYYQNGAPAQNTVCTGEVRQCNNGVLSGSYTAGTCTQVICTRASTSNTEAVACTTTTYNGGRVTGSTTNYQNGNGTSVNQSQGQAQSQSQSGNGGSASQSQSQAQAQSQSVNVNNSVTNSNTVNGNGTSNSSSNSSVVVSQQQAQAQAQSQQILQDASRGQSMVNQQQAQAQAQEQSVSIWNRMDAMMTRMLGL